MFLFWKARLCRKDLKHDWNVAKVRKIASTVNQKTMIDITQEMPATERLLNRKEEDDILELKKVATAIRNEKETYNQNCAKSIVHYVLRVGKRLFLPMRRKKGWNASKLCLYHKVEQLVRAKFGLNCRSCCYFTNLHFIAEISWKT